MAFWRSRVKTKVGRPATGALSTRLSKPSTTSAMTQETTAASRPPVQQDSPFLTLPLELIQNIAAYLDQTSAASLCLSSRYTCYAIGRNELSEHLSPSCSLPRFQRRKNIEILERAFPSHWYCSWCDTFHRHDVDGGPTKYTNETKRDCADFNSYLHDGREYVVCYHHVRLALNRALWGKEYGVGTEAFAYDEVVQRTSGSLDFSTRLRCGARIVEGRLVLHASYRVTTPARRTLFMTDIKAILPHVVTGHRDSHVPHSGLEKCLVNALGKGAKSTVQLCSVCATDFSVQYIRDQTDPSMSSDPQSVLEIKVWRDLGNGRNPFDASWRAHGELGKGREGFASDALRLASFQPGDIKKAFESGDPRFATGAPPLGMQRIDGSSLADSFNENWTQEIVRSRAIRGSAAGYVDRREHERTMLNMRNSTRWLVGSVEY